MSITAGATGVSQVVGASEEVVMQLPLAGVELTTLCVKCDASSPVSVRVRIPELHGTVANTGLIITPGEKEYFRVDDGGISAVYVSGSTGVIHWGGVSRSRGW